MRWPWRRQAEPTVITEPDPFIRPLHVCRPPKSERWGMTSWGPRDLDDEPPGTRWICSCGRGWIVNDLGYWERHKSDDVAELLEGAS